MVTSTPDPVPSPPIMPEEIYMTVDSPPPDPNEPWTPAEVPKVTPELAAAEAELQAEQDLRNAAATDPIANVKVQLLDKRAYLRQAQANAEAIEREVISLETLLAALEKTQ